MNHDEVGNQDGLEVVYLCDRAADEKSNTLIGPLPGLYLHYSSEPS